MSVDTRTATPAGTGRQVDAAAAEARRLKLFNTVFELRAFIALGVLIVIFGVLSDSFLTVDNLITMTKHVAINAVLAELSGKRPDFALNWAGVTAQREAAGREARADREDS